MDSLNWIVDPSPVEVRHVCHWKVLHHHRLTADGILHRVKVQNGNPGFVTRSVPANGWNLYIERINSLDIDVIWGFGGRGKHVRIIKKKKRTITRINSNIKSAVCSQKKAAHI